MAGGDRRSLKVFLCHASGDKPPVRELYKRLVFEGVDAWLDQEKLLPGQDWRLEIPRAVREADVVVICLSKKSVTKEGYVQKEIKFALDIAEEKPEGTIFLIPARLEDCPVPERLSRWQWVDLYEENGFIKLLRSLKLRADKVDAAVEPVSYEDADKELERRLDQLYTEGLAAFYTEDWDKACHRFQTILSERPNHKNANEKLVEAERQRNLAKLYAQSMEAYKAENWQTAINSLEELLQKSADYKDAGQLLKYARKQKRLKELYAEAKTLHAAQKWQAVVKVFEQISAIEPTYPDSEGLLPSAQKEVAELKRLAELNDLYSRGIREMEAGQWFEARRLLEQVHKSQTGFLETERLLKKVGDEITKVEEHNKRNNQINTLYEQAHGLIRSKSWRKALDKIEEIQKLDDQFVDKDGISDRSKTELEHQEQEAQRQNELAAMYAESVRLLKEEKYQEALNKWQEVKAVDSKYPDRQWVQVTARRKLSGATQPRAQLDVTKFNFAVINVSSSERMLLLAFLGTIIIRAIYGVININLHIWDAGTPVIPQFLNLFVLGGLYGAVIALSLGRLIHNWRLWHSWTVIIGWAFGLGSAVLIGRLGWDFMVGVMALCGLSVAGALKWADSKSSWFKIVVIFICWALMWKIGNISGAYLKNTFDNDYTWCIVDAITVLFGLLATFGIYEYASNRLIKLTILSILGFAVGNYIATFLSNILSFHPQLSNPIGLAVWGFIGGAIIELPSRDSKKILTLGCMCGLGLLLGYFVSLITLPPFVQLMLPGRYSILNNVLWGAGLGLAFCLPSRRISPIGLLTILGSSIFVITSIFYFNTILLLGNVWENIVRGGLIGLVLGFAYAYATRETGKTNYSGDVVGTR